MQIGRASSSAANAELCVYAGGVRADCPLAWHSVPVDKNSVACSGHGVAVAALGTCQCWPGYQGFACASCAPQYQLNNNICMRIPGSFPASSFKLVAAELPPPTASKLVSTVQPRSIVVATSAPPTEQNSGVNIGLVVGCLLGALVVLLALAVLPLVWRRLHRQGSSTALERRMLSEDSQDAKGGARADCTLAKADVSLSIPDSTVSKLIDDNRIQFDKCVHSAQLAPQF